VSSTIVLASLLVAAPAAFATQSDPGSTGSADSSGTITASDVPAGSTDIPDGTSTDPVHVESDGFDDAAKLELSGTLGVMAVDGSAAHVDEATGEVTPGSPSSVRYSVALDDGTSVPIEGDMHESLPTGSRFTGTVAIPDAVDSALPENARGPVSRSTDAPIDALSSTGAAVLAAAETAETPLPVVQAEIVPAQAQALAGASQQLFIAVVRPYRSFDDPNFYTDTQVDTLKTRLSTYWQGQSEGQISSMPYGASVLHFTSAYDDLCQDGARQYMWNEVVGAFGLGVNWHTTNYNGRHVIILTPDLHCDSIGVGSVGSLGSGGILQATMGIGLDLATVAHEFGHNLGLGHSNTYGCTDPAYVEDVNGAGTCGYVEYGDLYDVMGFGYCSGPSTCWDQPGALNVVGRLNLGVESVQTYALSSGAPSQTWTIPISAASGSSSATRGAALVDPLTGYYYFLEYRSGTGVDAGSFYATQPSTSQYRPGVRVSFGDNEAQSYAQQVMPATSNPSFRSLALQQGDTFGSQSGGLVVSVSSITNGVATLKVTARSTPTLVPALTGPAITGGTAIGATLSVTSNNWNVPGLGYTYAWQRNGSPIAGATSSSYATTALDEGYRITATVTASRSGYWSGQATTNAITVDSRAHRFTDVLPPDLFYTEIEWMSASGISLGYDNGDGTKSYHPFEDVSRQAMAAFLYRYSGETFTPPATPSFTDVPQAHPFYTAIEWMKARGISTGNADGTYSPLDPVSRQAMAAFLARLSGDTMPVVGTPAFSDVPNSNPFAAQVAWMKDSAISTGYPDGTFHPVEAVSRRAMAAFLFRFNNLAG